MPYTWKSSEHGSCVYYFPVPIPVLVSCSCHNKLSEPREIYSLTVLEVRSPKSSCQQGWFPLETLRENHFHASLLASLAACNHWYSLIHRRIIPISASVFILPSLLCLCVSSPFLLLIRTYIVGFRAHPNSGWSHLEIFILITLAKTLFQIKSHPEVPSGPIYGGNIVRCTIRHVISWIISSKFICWSTNPNTSWRDCTYSSLKY